MSAPFHTLYRGREALAEYERLEDIPVERLRDAELSRNPHHDPPLLVVFDTARLNAEG